MKWHFPVTEPVQVHYSSISLLILLVISYSKLPCLDLLENEQFVLETVIRVTFHLTILSKHFSAGSTQDTTWNIYSFLFQRAINKISFNFLGICLYKCWQMTCNSNVLLSAYFQYFFSSFSWVKVFLSILWSRNCKDFFFYCLSSVFIKKCLYIIYMYI